MSIIGIIGQYSALALHTFPCYSRVAGESMEHMKKVKIRELNDDFRKRLSGKGQFFITSGVGALPINELHDLVTKMVEFDDFTERNDPYGEHDFGVIKLGKETYYWKIDYYAPDMLHGSEDPSNEELTVRVLTLMRANEY